MSLIQKITSKLYRGVSTQAETNQLDGQVRESVNMLHSIEKGITRRNPTNLIAELNFTDELNKDVFIHHYARGDGIEKYMMIFSNNSLRVFDLEGNEKQVNFLGGSMPSLNVTNGNKVSKSFRCLTVGDTTFVVNTSKITAMTDRVDGILDSQLNNPFYWAKRSFDNGAGTGYNYTLDGATVNATRTDDVTSKLLTALGSTNYDRFGSILIRKNKPNTFKWSDSYGSQASEGFWGLAQKIEDLPNTMSGAELVYPIIIEIQGDPDNKFSNYWLQFTNGHWKETRKVGIRNQIDKTTMPFKVIRNELGQFDVEYITYADREKGDEFTAPTPSFIGKSISDIMFFKNRLCFLSGESVIMSETGMYYNFFPTTVTDVLPTDPIDVAVDSNNVAVLKHSVAFNDSILLFSNGSQFNLKAQSVIAPNDVSITNTTNYSIDVSVKPIPIGNSIFFMSNNLKGTTLREYFLDVNGTSNVAVDVSNHVEGYLPNNVTRLVGSSNKDMLMLLSSDESNTIYIYKFFNSGQDRIQTAWSKWVFTGEILDIFLIDEYLYILRKDSRISNKWIFEKLDYSNNDSINSFKDTYDTEYLSYVELSEVVLTDNQGKVVINARSPLMYKTIQVTSTPESRYKLRIRNKIRERVAENYSVKDNKVLVQGKSNEVDIFIESEGDSPLEFHTYTIELNHNMRAKLI